MPTRLTIEVAFLEEEFVSFSLTWPPEPERWYQQPAGQRPTSPCESLCTFASGLWSPWRRTETHKVRRSEYDGEFSTSAWEKFTGREVRPGEGTTGALPAAIAGGKDEGWERERERNLVQLQVGGSPPKDHSPGRECQPNQPSQVGWRRDKVC